MSVGVVELRLPGEGPSEGAHDLRTRVFVGEQGVPAEIEHDDLDAVATHADLVRDGAVVATGRLLDSPDVLGRARVGRMAVSPDVRGQGLGGVVLQALVAHAADRGHPGVLLHAQVHANGFYLAHGFVPHGEVFVEAGIDHQGMVHDLVPGLREVRDSDSEALIALYAAVWGEYEGVLLAVDEEEPWLRAPATLLAAKGARLWVVPGPGGIDACVGLRPAASGRWELKSLYVAAPARRGGLGARLVRFAERAARLGAGSATDVPMELWSDVKFTDAHRLYERLGWERTLPDRALHDLSGTVERGYTRG